MPRPRHPKTGGDEARAQFKASLGEKLEALNLPQGTKAKGWVMDEARFGLHTDLRRVGVPKGACPVVERETKHERDLPLRIMGSERRACALYASAHGEPRR